MTTVVLRRTDLNEMQKMRNRVQMLHFNFSGSRLTARWLSGVDIQVATSLFWTVSCWRRSNAFRNERGWHDIITYRN
jgi:hypothetical protein